MVWSVIGFGSAAKKTNCMRGRLVAHQLYSSSLALSLSGGAAVACWLFVVSSSRIGSAHHIVTCTCAEKDENKNDENKNIENKNILLVLIKYN